MNPFPPKSLIKELPTEILQEILTLLPDIISLKSIILASRYFYKAFYTAEKLITGQVLLNCFNQALLHDALASREASSRESWEPKDAEEFLSRYLNQNLVYPLTLKWNLSEALPIAQLHDDIQFLAINIASSSLANYSKSQESKGILSLSPPSTSEINRIQRALYRFEIYCSLFRGEHPPFNSGFEQIGPFFSQFAPWENEQLVCIYDYFVTIVYSALEELGTRDPDWVSYFAIVGDPSETCLQYQLSLGLHHLRRLVAANSYEESKRLIGTTSDQKHLFFLDDTLNDMTIRDSDNILAEMDSDDKDEYVSPPLFYDNDSGPEDVWRWAHQSSTCRSFVFSDSHIPLRKWAYVMWDRSRLDSWGVFDRPWESSEATQQDTSNIWANASTYQSRARMMVQGGKLAHSIHYT